MLLIGCLTSVLANITGISWQLLLLVEKTGVPRESKQPRRAHQTRRSGRLLRNRNYSAILAILQITSNQIKSNKFYLKSKYL
jgi:hypothetical protein